MKRANTWIVFTVVLAAMLVFPTSIMAQGNGQGNGNNETNVGITVNPPTTGGGAILQSTDVTTLDLVVSPDNPQATDTVTLTVHVNQAVSKVSVSAEISNKNHMKIKWYNLLENGHFLINGFSGYPGTKGSSWDFGTVWDSTGDFAAKGDHTISIPITVDLTAGGMDPYNIPEGSTNGQATIVWTLTIGTL